MPTHITLSDDNLLGEYVELDQFKRVLEQRVAIGPDLLAMLIKDGEIAEASPGGHFAIGGIWRTLKDAIGGKHSIRLMIADLKPFQLSTTATSLSRDNVPITCEFTIDLQVNPEKPANVLGLVKAHGKVTKQSVLERLKPNIGERVLNAAVRRVDAMELRGNNSLQDKVQADTMTEVDRVASDIGLIARSVSVAWGFNEEEKAAILKRQQEREQEALEREFKILTRSVEREADTTVMKLETDLTVEKAKVNTEDDLRRLILSNEFKFVDARETGIRIEQMKALEHEMHLNRTQRLDGLKTQLEGEQHAIDMLRMAGGKRGAERDNQIQDRRRDIELDGVDRERERERRDAGFAGDITARRHEIELDKIGGERRDVGRQGEVKDRLHEIELDKIARDRREGGRQGELKDRLHEVETEKVRGDRRDVELDTARRERVHGLEVTRIQSEIRMVERSVEDMDRRQVLALQKLEALQGIEIRERSQEERLKSMRGLQDIELDAEGVRLDHTIKGGDAAHRRQLELAQQAAMADIEKMRILRDGTPEQILAINAGFSAAVANVLVEQAKAKATEGTDRLALMREMIQQAKDANVASADQARTFFDRGMTGVTSVAQGVGAAIAAGRGLAAPAAGGGAQAGGAQGGGGAQVQAEHTECPGCGRKVPLADRHCRGCGRQLRQ